MMTDERLEQLLRDARQAAAPALPTRDAWRRVRTRLGAPQIEPQSRAFGARWFFGSALATACVAALILILMNNGTNDKQLRGNDLSPRVASAPIERAPKDAMLSPRESIGDHTRINTTLEPTTRPKSKANNPRPAPHSAFYVRTMTYGTGYEREVIEQNGRETIVTRGERLSLPIFSTVAATQRNRLADEQALAELEPSALERATVVRSANTLSRVTVVTLPSHDGGTISEEQSS